MGESTERALEKVIKYGAAFSEVSLPIRNRHGIDAYQVNEIAKAAFSVAEVTFEVRAHRWFNRSNGNTGPLAPAGAKQIRPDAVRHSGPVAAYFSFRGQGRK